MGGQNAWARLVSEYLTQQMKFSLSVSSCPCCRGPLNRFLCHQSIDMTVTNTLRSLSSSFFLALLLYGSSLSGLPTHVFPCHLLEVSGRWQRGKRRKEGRGSWARGDAGSFMSVSNGDGDHKFICWHRQRRRSLSSAASKFRLSAPRQQSLHYLPRTVNGERFVMPCAGACNQKLALSALNRVKS